MKKFISKRTARIFLILFIFVLLVSIAGGTYLFHFALARKATNEEAAITTDELAAESRAAARNWMKQQPFQQLSLIARDGTPLAGYYLAANNGKPVRLAVLVHGYGTGAFLMADYAQRYFADGFDVFAPDNRAHGASGGNWIGMGWLDKDDLLQWLGLLIQKAGPGCEIVLHGISMGASAILMMSGSLPPQVKCIIEDCGYTSAYAEFRHQLKEMFGLPPFPLLSIASLESRLIAGYSFTEASALRQIENSQTPTFFIHGMDDTFNPTDMARDLYEVASCEKELWLVPNAEHAMAYYVNPAEYSGRVRAFYGRYVTAGKHE
jgi:fermentation-respiration switch protein FrsA (DUF1100 family)